MHATCYSTNLSKQQFCALCYLLLHQTTTDRGAKYCEQRVCMSVHEHISRTTCPIFTNFLCMLPITMAQSSSDKCSDLLCTSGLMDYIIFAHNQGS